MTHPRLLGGRYELDGVVGRGGMAEVFRARDIRLDRIVAIKTLRSDLARDPTFQARFRREAQSAASLNHPSIIAVYDTGEGDMETNTPVPYIVMEFVDGRTLRDLLRADRRLLPERASELVDGILRALDYSHRGGIVHRDIKPANVMITRAGDVKVMDFGIARAMAGHDATMTQTAQVIGTAQYLSPEQARGERVDARSDIYSTGCVLYELLTGQPPFTGDSPVAIAYQHVREEPIPPSQIDPEIPEWADAVVLKAMAKDPAHRYQSAGEMRQDLQRAMSGMPVDAQTTAMAVNHNAHTRTMQQPPQGSGPATQLAGDMRPYEYGEEGGRVGRRRRADSGGNNTVKTAAWIIVPLLVIGAFIGVGFMLFNSGGTTESATVKIPALATVERAAAEKRLANLGLKVEVKQEFSDDVEKNTVIKTEPPADTEVDKESTVTLFVSKGVEQATVPDVVNRTREEAIDLLEAEGLEAVVVQEPSSKPENTVFKTDPEAGEKVDKKSSVRIYIPQAAIDLPDVTSQEVGDAQRTLRGAGFKVKVVREYSDSVTEGHVISQTPQGGSKQRGGITVTLVVSNGPPTPQPPPVEEEPPPSDTPPTQDVPEEPTDPFPDEGDPGAGDGDLG
ncbi:Stk1 family PASTA domain-containing Ser/Thr kinase [Sinosporangium siamense]|uniref:non-specific serine/threonine protein kinase n=1 Tax=Sinosporangium siamense TaxID=1367973 RepID=A0A919RN11_9ACTN|nr:Stk1 family PASTA domain-containing Ser/Thr kinase [Sinosporangium siamense]GII95855.1 putative serine/threonine-protein kinase [Sinosporangium siamense]